MDDDLWRDRAIGADGDELADVMYHAVRHGRSFYTEAQSAPWVSEPRRGPAWRVDWTARRSPWR